MEGDTSYLEPSDELLEFPPGRYPHAAVAAMRFATLKVDATILVGLDYERMSQVSTGSHPSNNANLLTPAEELIALERVLGRAKEVTHTRHWSDWGRVRVEPYYVGCPKLRKAISEEMRSNHSLRDRVGDVDAIVWCELEDADMAYYN